ncbi:MAG: hypothetical protein WCT04_21195 [Planctomycetota bacterium]
MVSECRTENAGALPQDRLHIPLSGTKNALKASTELGCKLVALLDPETAVTLVMTGAIRAELKTPDNIMKTRGRRSGVFAGEAQAAREVIRGPRFAIENGNRRLLFRGQRHGGLEVTWVRDPLPKQNATEHGSSLGTAGQRWFLGCARWARWARKFRFNSYPTLLRRARGFLWSGFPCKRIYF